MKVNLGSGQAYMQGWVNVDPNPDVKADVYADAIDFVLDNGPEIEEVYLGHVLEHLLPGDAFSLLRLLCERLTAGATVSAVVPDMKAIFQAYQDGEITNEELNASYIYSYVQPSHHVWCYDPDSLSELFQRAGFSGVSPIDPPTWPPVYWKDGPDSRWQCGVRAESTGVLSAGPAPEPYGASTGTGQPVRTGPVTAEELLLQRVRRLREQLAASSAPAHDAGDGPNGSVPASTRSRPPEPVEDGPTHSRLGAAVRRIVPAGSRPRMVAAAGVETVRALRGTRDRLQDIWVLPGFREPASPDYEKWCNEHDAPQWQLRRQAAEAGRVRWPLRAAGLILADGDGPALTRTLGSLMAQSWPHWKALVLVPAGVDLDERAIPTDARVRRVQTETDDAPADLNRAAGMVDPTSFLMFLESGDELAPDCVYQIASMARQDPLLDLLYWDDDVLADSSRVDPRFRPGWSPELLVGANYIGRSFAMRHARYVVAGGIRPELGPACFWDLLLRSGLDDERVARVPRVLGHVRRRVDQVEEHGLRAVGDHLASRGVPATAELAGTSVRLHWERSLTPTVTVVIPTRHNRDMVGRCLRSLHLTDYPSFEVVVVDNGEATAANKDWYGQFDGLDLRVFWWTEPFNYSAVNNYGARQGTGQILVFLNDDTEVVDPGWMRELVGWATRPEIGVVGLQLVDPEGKLQHAGAVLGIGGFADHVFGGMAPGSPSLLGDTAWYRNVLAVTGACLGIDRDLFDQVGGFDERFILCGSDVAIGLDARLQGRRNVCSPFARLLHQESATRGTDIPRRDFFTSYWRYQFWLFGGDPYFSPNLSLASRIPRLRPHNEPSPADRLSVTLGRRFEAFRQTSDAVEATGLADIARAGVDDVRAVRALHQASAGNLPVRTLNWFIPDIDSPFYGGINTALRMADHLARHHQVENRFLVWGHGPEDFMRSALLAAFPALAGSTVAFHDGTAASIDELPEADASIATLWLTAYAVSTFAHTRRKFYLVQDFEPMFYPAGTLYALAEETYRLGLYGIANTENLRRVYETDYGGRGTYFTPAVDRSVFHAHGRPERTADAPVTVFVYARPGHWRNCWELASLALRDLKERLGDKVRIVTAGSWAVAESGSTMRHMGLMDYRATGDLYRRCDIGLALTVSKHPSYLPLELMACGVPVVAFDNSWGHWILRHDENSLLAMRTVHGISDALERLVVDLELRRRLSRRAVEDIEANHSSWPTAFSGIYDYLCDPEGTRRG